MVSLLLSRWDLRWTVVTLVPLLVLDVVNAAFYIGHVFALNDMAPDWLASTQFNMNREFSLGEDIEYLKSLACAGVIGFCFFRTRQVVFAALALLHLWMAADNSLGVHEWIGVTLGEVLLRGNTMGMSRPTDPVELIYHVLLGLGLAGLFLALLRRTSPEFAPASIILVLAAISPGFFGVFVDALHGTPLGEAMSNTMLVLVEDGGETVMLSLATALSVGFARGLLEPPGGEAARERTAVAAE